MRTALAACNKGKQDGTQNFMIFHKNRKTY